MIKAIIFDIDGVLLDSYKANFVFYQDLMNKAGYPEKPSREEFSNSFHLTMYDAIRQMTQLEDEASIKKIWEMGKSRAVPYRQDLLAMPAGCEDTLIKLHQMVRLGIVTSRIWNSVFESPLLAKLKDIFDVTVSYEDTDNHKPHPDPLLLATKKLGLRPEECVYVGDMPSDIQAANAANMKVILYSKVTIEGADAETNDFTMLPEIVAKL